MIDCLGYVKITDFDKFISAYEKFCEDHQGQNLWYDYKLSTWMEEHPKLTRTDYDLYRLYDAYYKSAIASKDSFEYHFNYMFKNTVDSLREIFEFQTEFGQKFKLIYKDDIFSIFTFGKFTFLAFFTEGLEFEYLKDYSDLTIKQLRGSIQNNESVTSLTSANSLSDKSVKTAKSEIADKRKQVEQLQANMDEVKQCKTKELAAIQEEINNKMAELENKKRAMMEALEQKKLEMQEMLQNLENQLFVLETEIYAIRCFLGEVVEFTQLRSGKYQPSDQPVVLFQKMKYLDEELGKLISLYNVDFDDVKLFEKYLKINDFAFNTFCPSSKCISLIRVSKTNRTLGLHPDITNMIVAYEKYHGRTVGILVRDGDNLFIGWTDDEHINIHDDMFYVPGTTTYVNEEDAKAQGQSSKEEIASRYCVFSILQGLLENGEGNIIRLDGKHNFTKPDNMIIYSAADNWLADNRFGTLSDLVEKYSDDINIKYGDEIISIQSVRPNTKSNMWGYTNNDRGIGYANRTHDVSLANAEVIKINKIVTEHNWYIHYIDTSSVVQSHYKTDIHCRDEEAGPTQEQINEWILKNPKKIFEFVKDEPYTMYYVSLEKDLRWDRERSDYKVLPKANFQVYKDEFINLVFFNSIWLEYVITNKAIGSGIRLGKYTVTYADIIKHLKYALDAVRAREAKEAEEINKFINLDDYPEWQLKLSDFKYENDIHHIGPKYARQFAKYLKESEVK